MSREVVAYQGNLVDRDHTTGMVVVVDVNGEQQVTRARNVRWLQPETEVHDVDEQVQHEASQRPLGFAVAERAEQTSRVETFAPTSPVGSFTLRQALQSEFL